MNTKQTGFIKKPTAFHPDDFYTPTKRNVPLDMTLSVLKAMIVFAVVFLVAFVLYSFITA